MTLFLEYAVLWIKGNKLLTALFLLSIGLFVYNKTLVSDISDLKEQLSMTTNALNESKIDLAVQKQNVKDLSNSLDKRNKAVIDLGVASQQKQQDVKNALSELQTKFDKINDQNKKLKEFKSSGNECQDAGELLDNVGE